MALREPLRLSQAAQRFRYGAAILERVGLNGGQWMTKDELPGTPQEYRAIPICPLCLSLAHAQPRKKESPASRLGRYKKSVGLAHAKSRFLWIMRTPMGVGVAMVQREVKKEELSLDQILNALTPAQKELFKWEISVGLPLQGGER